MGTYVITQKCFSEEQVKTYDSPLAVIHSCIFISLHPSPPLKNSYLSYLEKCPLKLGAVFVRRTVENLRHVDDFAFTNVITHSIHLLLRYFSHQVR